MKTLRVNLRRKELEQHLMALLNEDQTSMIVYFSNNGIPIKNTDQPIGKIQRVIGFMRLLPGESSNETIIQFVHEAPNSWQELDDDVSHLDAFINKTIEHFRICGITMASDPKPIAIPRASSRIIFESQFVGNLKDIEQRLDYFNREEQSRVQGPFVRVWIADKQVDELLTRFILMGMARDEPEKGKFGNYLIGEVIVLEHGNWVKGEAFDSQANDYFEKLGKWLVDGILPILESNQPTDLALDASQKRHIEKSKQLTAILDYWLLQLEDNGFEVQRREFGEIVIWNVVKGDFQAEIRQVWGKDAEVRLDNDDLTTQAYQAAKAQFTSVCNLIPALHMQWAREEVAATAAKQPTGSAVQRSGLGELRKPEKPTMPKRKKEGGKLSEWFKWYDDMGRAGFKCSLMEVAKESCYSYGYIKQEHAKYAREAAQT